MNASGLANLGIALHRKLVRYSDDIRIEAKRKQRDEKRIVELKAARKILDQAYSSCLHSQKEKDPEKLKTLYVALKKEYDRL